MGWRDILMIILGVGCVPIALYNAFYGLLAYFWLSFMSPQSLVWDDRVREARFTLAVGSVMAYRAALTFGPRFRIRLPSLIFVAFWGWMAVCTWNSTHVEQSLVFLEKFSKIGLAAILMTGLVRTREQLKWTIILLAACPGFYAIKLGLFLLGGATATHHGGPLGMDNNDIAMFISMGIPMLAFSVVEMTNKWARRIFIAAAVLAVPAVIVGESRGGMLAMVAAGLMTLGRKTAWWKAVFLGAVAIPLAIALVPPSTMARYKTIESYEKDGSAVARLRAWNTATRMVQASPLVGVGVSAETFMLEYTKYMDNKDDYPHVAHSVWFTTLSGMGYPGLILFIAMIVSVFATNFRTRYLASRYLGEDGEWARQYASMIDTTLIAYAIAGSFLSQMGFEYVYAILMLSVPLYVITSEEVDKVTLVEGEGEVKYEAFAAQ